MKHLDVIPELWEVLRDRLAHPREGSYVNRLARGEKGIDGILEKVGEEAAEFIIAVKNGERRDIVWEAADLEFHLLLALAAAGVDLEEVLSELEKRRHPEKGKV
ncbi:MAG TPA: phosphoribosyl-ATP diphosphatase [Methanomicrobiales archaeon]|nr:phosphoribosyl-ATP diphosphatase [Methanomicrobiales archaeon]